MCFNPFAQPDPKKPFFKKISKEEKRIKSLIVLKNAVAYVCGNRIKIVRLQDGKKENVEFENQSEILCRFQENYLVVNCKESKESFLFDINTQSKEILDGGYITCASSFEDKIIYDSFGEVRFAEPLRGIFKTVFKKKKAYYDYLILNESKLFYGFFFRSILRGHYRICMYDTVINEERLIFKSPHIVKFIPLDNLFVVWKASLHENIYKIKIHLDPEKDKEKRKTEKIKFSKFTDLVPFKNQNVIYYTFQTIGLLFINYSSQKRVFTGDEFTDEYGRSGKGGIVKVTTYEKSRSGSSSWIWWG